MYYPGWIISSKIGDIANYVFFFALLGLAEIHKYWITNQIISSIWVLTDLWQRWVLWFQKVEPRRINTKLSPLQRSRTNHQEIHGTKANSGILKKKNKTVTYESIVVHKQRWLDSSCVNHQNCVVAQINAVRDFAQGLVKSYGKNSSNPSWKNTFFKVD